MIGPLQIYFNFQLQSIFLKTNFRFNSIIKIFWHLTVVLQRFGTFWKSKKWIIFQKNLQIDTSWCHFFVTSNKQWIRLRTTWKNKLKTHVRRISIDKKSLGDGRATGDDSFRYLSYLAIGLNWKNITVYLNRYLWKFSIFFQ